MRTSRALAAAGIGLAALSLSACEIFGVSVGGGVPGRAPEAVGTAMQVTVSGETTSVLFAPELGYEYFEGTTFVLDADVVVTGAVADAADIVAGDRLNVWTQECAESYPVQCTVEAVEVLGR